MAAHRGQEWLGRSLELSNCVSFSWGLCILNEFCLIAEMKIYAQITIRGAIRQAEWARQMELKEVMGWCTQIILEIYMSTPFSLAQPPQGFFSGPLDFN